MQQQRPVLPHDNDGDPLQEGLDDLQFMTSVDTTVQQNVAVDPNRPTAGAIPPGVETTYDTGSGPIAGPGGRTQGGVGSSASSVVSFVQESASAVLRDSSHPVAAVFHVIFKILALLLYIFGGWFSRGSNFVTITVLCIITLSLDFWVVKNITGRLLVGLRWWNKVNDDGSTKWIFESAEKRYDNKIDNNIFWTVTYGTPFVWAALFIFGLLKFEFGWLLIVVVALVLSGSNVYGYWKCSSDQKAKFQQLVSRGAEMGAAAAVRHNVVGKISNFALSRAQGQQQQPQGVHGTNPSGNFA